MSYVIYIEGAPTKSLQSDLRKAFVQLLNKLAVEPKPKVVACGSGRETYKSFLIAMKNNQKALMLIDSEKNIEKLKFDQVLDFLQQQWNDVSAEIEPNCVHLMVQCMETWFLADTAAIKTFFGKDFQENNLPKHSNIEQIETNAVLKALKKASENTRKPYHKGDHSFKILAELDPEKISQKSQWAKRFFDHVSGVN